MAAGDPSLQPGHNAPPARQWQVPHRHGAASEPDPAPVEPDLDLVEAAFVEGFEHTSDPTSFLRLARVPFVTEQNGRRLELLRVEVESQTDVATVAPQRGGGRPRVAPLPEALVSRRRTLRLVYLGPDGPAALDLATARDLPDRTPPR